MYSTRLKDERFSVECIVYTEKVRIIQYVVDTGAKYTCCNYKEFDKHMKEEEFILGMDILKQITFLANADNKQICFYKDYIECKKMIIVDCGSEAGMDCPGGGAAVVL